MSRPCPWTKRRNIGWSGVGTNPKVTFSDFLPDDQRKLEAMLEISSLAMDQMLR
jgi:hypothetical protein